MCDGVDVGAVCNCIYISERVCVNAEDMCVYLWMYVLCKNLGEYMCMCISVNVCVSVCV